MRKYRYLLGDSKREAERLARQARLWDPIAHALFDRLKVRPGMKVLEIGPGRGSLHLELRRRVRGPVDAVEHSEAFARNLVALCERDRRGQGKIWNQDLLDAPLPRAHYDLIFARWVFLFLPGPRAHLRKLVRALKPGGRIAIQDYHRETMAMVPRPPHWNEFLAADRAFFESQGGNASIGAFLPEHFKACGLAITEIQPHVKTGHPGSDEWNWMSDYFLDILNRYAEFRPFTPAKAQELRKCWKQAARAKTSVLFGPTVLDLVGRKPRR